MNGRNNRRNGDVGEREDRPVRSDPGRRQRNDRPASHAVSPSRLAEDRPVPPGGDESGAIASQPVSVETDAVAATLVSVPLVDIRELVYEHQVDPARLDRGETTQPVALFDLHNVGTDPVKWTSARARFIGDDGYSYKPAQLSIDPGELGPGIHTRRVEIRPDRRARVATLVEQLPAGVEIAEVVQPVTVAATRGETEQLVFELA